MYYMFSYNQFLRLIYLSYISFLLITFFNNFDLIIKELKSLRN